VVSPTHDRLPPTLPPRDTLKQKYLYTKMLFFCQSQQLIFFHMFRPITTVIGLPIQNLKVKWYIKNIQNSWPLKIGPIGCPETSVRIAATRCVITQKSAVLIYLASEACNHPVIFSPWDPMSLQWLLQYQCGPG